MMQRRGKNKLVNMAVATDDTKKMASSGAETTSAAATNAPNPKVLQASTQGGGNWDGSEDNSFPSTGYAVVVGNSVKRNAATTLSTTMKKLGQHKLVLKGSTNIPTSLSGGIAGVTATSTATATARQDGASKATTSNTNTISKPHLSQQLGLTKKGSNKLVLNTAVAGGSSSQSGGSYFHDNGTYNGNFKREHHNPYAIDNRRPRSNPHPSTQYHHHHTHQTYNPRHHEHHHHHNHNHNHNRGAKRIKLGLSRAESNDSGDGGEEENAVVADIVKNDHTNTTENQESQDGEHITNNKEVPLTTMTGAKEPEEKLTDFAYRETHKVRQIGGNKRWTKATAGQNSPSGAAATGFGAGVGTTSTSHRNGSRSMGLVRVRPDTANTPICPTFLRGLACPDKYCTKRHDIPKEFAMPVCSFFQRHGQCLKENCQFRHVKVNARAMICPSFALLGYCEDPECVMKHERPSSSQSQQNHDRPKNNIIKTVNHHNNTGSDRGTKKNEYNQTLPNRRYWDNPDP